MTEYVVQVEKNGKWLSAKKTADVNAACTLSERFSSEYPDVKVRVIESYFGTDGVTQRWRPHKMFVGGAPVESKGSPPEKMMIQHQKGQPSRSDAATVANNPTRFESSIKELDAASDPTLLFVMKFFPSFCIYGIFWFRRVARLLNNISRTPVYPEGLWRIGCWVYGIPAYVAVLGYLGIMNGKMSSVLMVIFAIFDRYVSSLGTKALRELNEPLGQKFVTRGSKLWAYIFGAVYINYKINRACDLQARLSKQTDGEKSPAPQSSLKNNLTSAPDREESATQLTATQEETDGKAKKANNNFLTGSSESRLDQKHPQGSSNHEKSNGESADVEIAEQQSAIRGQDIAFAVVIAIFAVVFIVLANR